MPSFIIAGYSSDEHEDKHHTLKIDATTQCGVSIPVLNTSTIIRKNIPGVYVKALLAAHHADTDHYLDCAGDDAAAVKQCRHHHVMVAKDIHSAIKTKGMTTIAVE